MRLFNEKKELTNHQHDYVITGMLMATGLWMAKRRVAAAIVGISTYGYYNNCKGTLDRKTFEYYSNKISENLTAFANLPKWIF